jgi:hypothetical protein
LRWALAGSSDSNWTTWRSRRTIPIPRQTASTRLWRWAVIVLVQ